MRKAVVVLFLASSAVYAQSGIPQPGEPQERVQQVQAGGSPLVTGAEAAGPVPKLPDGHVDLTGPWVGGGSNADIEKDGGLKPGELPLLPWAKELRDKRKAQDEPYTACLPMSVPRVNPYPWKFAMSYTNKGLTHIYILHETGDAGAHRVVYMDGRKHPDDLIPSWWGHSIGRWEGDTLVIDTVGYNDKFWFDSRAPHIPTSCTPSSAGRARTTARSSTSSRSRIRGPFATRAAEVHGEVAEAESEGRWW
jgi:hypothetical protein